MRQRRRHRSSASIPGGVMLRLSSAIVALLILGMIYTRARDPQTWRWMAPEGDLPPAAAIPAQAGPNVPPPTPPETVIPGPTDLDELDSPEVQTQFLAIDDKSAIAAEDMPAYWRLMRWARAQTFDDLQQRSRSDVLYVQYFEEPDQFRGRPMQLRLHVKQIVAWDAPENSAGLKTVYEVSGTSDAQPTYFYIAICPELPPGMQPGTGLNEEGVFVGYFLKVMPYKASVKGLAAPIVIGRLRGVPRVATPPAPQLPTWVWLTGAAVILAAAAWGWRQFANAPPRRRVQTADVGVEGATEWFVQQSVDAPIDQPAPPDDPNPS